MWPEFRDSIAGLLGRRPETVVVATLEETDAIRARFSERMSAPKERLNPEYVQIETVSQDALLAAVESVKARFPDVEMLLFREKSEFCGAVRVKSSELFDHFLALFELDGEDLVACTSDGAAGLFAAWWEEPNHPVISMAYAFRAWYSPSPP
ncbi:MAG TPA: hypothetical protein VFU01_10865 [Gemmatimonadaceae bacterium]|nr:hypothetical protein [Gemmatimonadaceae bacterium]